MTAQLLNQAGLSHTLALTKEVYFSHFCIYFICKPQRGEQKSTCTAKCSSAPGAAPAKPEPGPLCCFNSCAGTDYFCSLICHRSGVTFPSRDRDGVSGRGGSRDTIAAIRASLIYVVAGLGLSLPLLQPTRSNLAEGNAVIPDLCSYNRGKNLSHLGFFQRWERQRITAPSQDI